MWNYHMSWRYRPLDELCCDIFRLRWNLALVWKPQNTTFWILPIWRRGVSSFLILRLKYGRCLFGQRAPFWALWDCSLSKFRGGKGGVTISLSENIGRFNSIDILNVSNEKLCRSYSQLNVLIDLKNCSPTSKESWMKRDVTYLDLTSKQEWRHSENQMMGGNRLNYCNLPLEAK